MKISTCEGQVDLVYLQVGNFVAVSVEKFNQVRVNGGRNAAMMPTQKVQRQSSYPSLNSENGLRDEDLLSVQFRPLRKRREKSLKTWRNRSGCKEEFSREREAKN